MTDLIKIIQKLYLAKLKAECEAKIYKMKCEKYHNELMKKSKRENDMYKFLNTIDQKIQEGNKILYDNITELFHKEMEDLKEKINKEIQDLRKENHQIKIEANQNQVMASNNVSSYEIHHCDIFDAVKLGDLSLVMSLIDEDPLNLNKIGMYNMTPLHDACSWGYFPIVEFLINNGAEIDSLSSYYSTPLHIACEKGHLDVCKLLIENGANIESRDFDHWTPLHWAAFSGQVECVSYLIEKGADIHVKCKKNKSVLECASMSEMNQGMLPILQILLNSE